MLRSLIALAFAVLVPVAALAEAQVAIEAPWARASIGTARPGAAYFTLRNTGDQPVTLTGIRSEIAGMASIHNSTTNEMGVSTMAPAGDIELAPGEAVALEPGGLHAMLMDLQSPMVEGTEIPLVLLFQDGSERAIEVPVLGIAARGPEG